jgi:Zn-dependent M28 family amino/carboxypeptidase
VDVYPGLEAGIVLNVAAAAKLFAGESRSIERIWADASAGRHQSFTLRASIAISTRSRLRHLESANVVGMLEGSDPGLRTEHVVLMAHLDHIGQGVAVDGDAIYNGALDNAGGVAVLLETSRAIAKAPVRPRRSILFLATTAEERGLHGSRHYALNPTVPKDSIVAALNIDMPVALYPTAGYTVIGAEHSTLGDVARAALEAEGLRSLPNLAPERGLFTYTDQYSFVRAGIPSLYLHDGPVSSDPAIDAQQVFDDYLARHYHQVSDDTSLPIDWTSLAKLAQVHARLCLAVANAPERPSWLPGDFFGQAFGADRN